MSFSKSNVSRSGECVCAPVMFYQAYLNTAVCVCVCVCVCLLMLGFSRTWFPLLFGGRAADIEVDVRLQDLWLHGETELSDLTVCDSVCVRVCVWECVRVCEPHSTVRGGWEYSQVARRVNEWKLCDGYRVSSAGLYKDVKKWKIENNNRLSIYAREMSCNNWSTNHLVDGQKRTANAR